MQLSEAPRAGFEPALSMSSSFVVRCCVVVIPTKPNDLLHDTFTIINEVIDESWVNNGRTVHKELLLSVIFLLSRFSKFNLLVFFKCYLTKISLSVLVLFLSDGLMFLE